MAVRIDSSACTGCGACEGSCPVFALKMTDGKATVNDDCIECGACIEECPAQAITLAPGGA